jgi:hypothetical protein
MAKVKTSKINYAIPGEPLSQQEMEQMLKEAESGTFHSMQELKDKIAKWKAKFAK